MLEDVESLPDSWEVVKLGNFVESEKGKKPKNQQTHQSEKFKYPYIDIEAFEKSVIKSYSDGENCRFCNEEDFLMVWDGSRSGLVGKGMNGALGSTLVRINFPYILNDYAYYFLKSKYLQINSRAKGSGTPHVDPDLLWNYQFPIPSENEQHRIVAKIEQLFSELDKGIENLKKAREQLKVYRQAVLKHAFEGKLTEQWRKENADKLETAEQLLTRIQKEREARYQQQLNDWKKAVKKWEVDGREGKKPAKPKILKKIIINERELQDSPALNSNWVYCTLGNLIDDPKYGTSKKCDYDSGQTGVLRIPNILSERVDSQDLKFANFDDYELHEYSLLEGDILIIRSNGSISIVGKCALIEKEDTSHIYAGYLIRLRSNRVLLDPRYLLYLFQSHQLRKQIEFKAKSTSGVNNINSGELQSLIVPIMGLDEQQIVVTKLDENLSVISKLLSEIESNLIFSESLRQSILKKAFSGQLVEQDPNDEPASVLLERIKAEKEKRKKAAPKKKTARKKSKKRKVAA